MKNIALTLCLAVLLAACSSGNSVSETPTSTTGLYRGAFESSNSDSKNDGVMILNIVESDTGTISGTIQFEFSATQSTCFRPGTIEGTVTGFTVNITSTQGGGTLTLQLTFDGRSVLSGTFVVSADASCSPFSGSGSITLTR